MTAQAWSRGGVAHPPNRRQEVPDIDRLVTARITTIVKRPPHGCRMHHEYSESARYSLASGIGCTGTQTVASMEG